MLLALPRELPGREAVQRREGRTEGRTTLQQC